MDSLDLSHNGSDTSLATERHHMKEQLLHVKQTLNAMASPSLQPLLAPGPSAGGLPTRTPLKPGQVGMEGLLEDISARLSSIESIYSDMSGRLVRVDHRMGHTERSVRELQHISAGAINETARLVDIVGTGCAVSPLGRGSALLMSPPPAPRAPRDLDLAFVGAQQSPAVINQHASQINKLVAGLDFLEQHIIRQDQVIDGMQKQLITVARDISTTASLHASPNELALRVHDLSELVNKLRSHMWKVEKKIRTLEGNNDASVQELAKRVDQLCSCMDQATSGGAAMLKLAADDAGIRNPLFLQPEEMNSRNAPTGTTDDQGTHLQLAALQQTQLELRDTMDTFNQSLAALTQQVQAASLQHELPGSGPADIAELKAQMAQLLAAQANQAATTVARATAAAEAALVDTDYKIEEVRAHQAVAAESAMALTAEVQHLEEQLHVLAEQCKAAGAATTDTLSTLGIQATTAQQSSSDTAALVAQLQLELSNLSLSVSAVSERACAAEATSCAAVKSASQLNDRLTLETLPQLERELQTLFDHVTANAAAINVLSSDQQHASLTALQELADRVDCDRLEVSEQQQTLHAAMAEMSLLLQGQAEAVQDLEAAKHQQQARLTSLQSQVDTMAVELSDTVARADQVTEELGEKLDILRTDLMQVAPELQHCTHTINDLKDQAAAWESLEATTAGLQRSLEGLQGEQQTMHMSIDMLSSQLLDVVGRLDDDATTRVKDELALRHELQELQGQLSEVHDAQAADAAEMRTELADALMSSAASVQATELINQAVERLSWNLDAIQAALAGKAGQEDLCTVSSSVGAVQALLQDTASQVADIKMSLSRDIMTHEKLAALLAARDDMAAAVAKLQLVFSTGALATDQALAAKPAQPAPAISVPEAVAPPQVSAALEELSNRMDSCQSQLQSQLQQVNLLLYRSEGVVRQEQLASLKQAMMSLELQVKRQLASMCVITEAERLQPAAAATVTFAAVAEKSVTPAVAQVAEGAEVTFVDTPESASEAGAAAAVSEASVGSDVRCFGADLRHLEELAAGSTGATAASITAAPTAGSVDDLDMSRAQSCTSLQAGHMLTLLEAVQHIRALEVQVRELRDCTVATEAVVFDEVPTLKAAVANLQSRLLSTAAASSSPDAAPTGEQGEGQVVSASTTPSQTPLLPLGRPAQHQSGCQPASPSSAFPPAGWAADTQLRMDQLDASLLCRIALLESCLADPRPAASSLVLPNDPQQLAHPLTLTHAEHSPTTGAQPDLSQLWSAVTSIRAQLDEVQLAMSQGPSVITSQEAVPPNSRAESTAGWDEELQVLRTSVTKLEEGMAQMASTLADSALHSQLAQAIEAVSETFSAQLAAVTARLEAMISTQQGVTSSSAGPEVKDDGAVQEHSASTSAFPTQEDGGPALESCEDAAGAVEEPAARPSLALAGSLHADTQARLDALEGAYVGLTMQHGDYSRMMGELVVKMPMFCTKAELLNVADDVLRCCRDVAACYTAVEQLAIYATSQLPGQVQEDVQKLARRQAELETLVATLPVDSMPAASQAAAHSNPLQARVANLELRCNQLSLQHDEVIGAVAELHHKWAMVATADVECVARQTGSERTGDGEPVATLSDWQAIAPHPVRQYPL
ncbi:hypothetical protein QJQ45_002502 [Haematococcus lacustris]|nr:hypothetical protein QJQ45_002502 [Haematococcus lacustris]